MQGTMANLSSSSLPQPQTTFLPVLVLIRLWESVTIIRACQVSGLSRFSCEIKNGLWHGIFFWILWICLLENMLSANSSAISMYFLHLTLFPTCIIVVFYRKVVDWLFSVLALLQIVVSLCWYFKITSLPSQAHPRRNYVSSALTKPVMFWVLSTLLNKALWEGYPAKVDTLLNTKCPSFIQN